MPVSTLVDSHLASEYILIKSVDLGYSQGAPLQVNCVGVPFVPLGCGSNNKFVLVQDMSRAKYGNADN